MTEHKPGDLAGPPLANPERLHDGDGCMIYRQPGTPAYECCACCRGATWGECRTGHVKPCQIHQLVSRG